MRRHHAGSPAPGIIHHPTRHVPRAAAPAWAALLAGAIAGTTAPALLGAQATGGGGSATVRTMRDVCAADDLAMMERAQQFRREIVRSRANPAHARSGDSTAVRIITPRRPSAAEEREMRALVEAGRSASGMFQMRHGPVGWIGVSISGPSVQWVANGGKATIRYCGYPEVVSVEPASPARRAGIMAGDTLVAYNGRDVTKTDVVLDTLLIPGARVRMRVRREGRTQDRVVTIARRPDIALVPSTSVPRSPTPPLPPGITVSSARSGATSSEVIRGTVSARRLPVPIVTSFSFGAEPGVIAGAQMVATDEQLRESLKLDRGILVLKVAPDTPAAAAGLRAGDVIQTANGQDVNSAAGLYRVIQSSNGDRTVRLELKRDKKKKTVELRW